MITGMFRVRGEAFSSLRMAIPSSPGSMISRRISSGGSCFIASQKGTLSGKPLAEKPAVFKVYSIRSRML